MAGFVCFFKRSGGVGGSKRRNINTGPTNRSGILKCYVYNTNKTEQRQGRREGVVIAAAVAVVVVVAVAVTVVVTALLCSSASSPCFI